MLGLGAVNYHHLGAPKRWYAVPHAAIQQFEACFKATLPNLFKRHPDVLSHLVTMLSPRILKEHNVPVYGVLQVLQPPLPAPAQTFLVAMPSWCAHSACRDSLHFRCSLVLGTAIRRDLRWPSFTRLRSWSVFVWFCWSFCTLVACRSEVAVRQAQNTLASW